MNDENRKYRIRWTAMLTGATGVGSASFDIRDARDIADALNKKHVLHRIIHTIELCSMEGDGSLDTEE